MPHERLHVPRGVDWTPEQAEATSRAAAGWVLRNENGDPSALRDLLEHLGLVKHEIVVAPPPKPKSLNKLSGRSSSGKYVPVADLTPEQLEKRREKARRKRDNARKRGSIKGLGDP